MTTPAKPPPLDLDLDVILAAAEQVGWWTMNRPQVERLITAVRERDAEIRRLRGQLDDERCRVHHIQVRVEQTPLDGSEARLALDLIPYLDGPLHPSHVAAYHAAQES